MPPAGSSLRVHICVAEVITSAARRLFRDKTTLVLLPPDIDEQELQRNKCQMPSRPSLRCVVGNKLIKAVGFGFFFLFFERSSL